MNVTLRQLRAFLAVGRTASFTLAADSLFITQSALSGLIKEMEQGLNLRLVDRTTRRVGLTAVGAELYPQIEHLLKDLDSMLLRATNQQALKTGVVRVAASQLLASALMPSLIAAFGVKYPAISVKLVDTQVENVMARVFAGEVDFGIGPERQPNSDIVSAPLFEGPFMAVFPPDHELSRLKTVRWTDLMRYPVISLRGPFTELLSRDLHAVDPNLHLRAAQEVTYMATALSMVQAGLGVSICTPYAASLVQAYDLQMRRVKRPEVTRKFDVFLLKGRSLPPAAQRFLDFIGPKIRSMPDLK